MCSQFSRLADMSTLLLSGGMRCGAWLFDRSGPYSSTAFDSYEEPERFIRTIAAYSMMSDEKLGLDTFIERNDNDQLVNVVEDVTTGKERELQLELVLRQAMAGSKFPQISTRKRSGGGCQSIL